MARFSGALCFVVSGLALYLGLVLGSMQRASLTWPTATGRIEKLETATKYIPTRYGSMERKFPIVRYTYTVQGNQFQSTDVSLLHADELSHVLADYFDFQSEEWKSTGWSEGAAVTVHYDPSHPDKSYLLKTASGLPIYMLMFCIVPLIIGVGTRLERSAGGAGFWESLLRLACPRGKVNVWLFGYLALHPLITLSWYGWDVAALRPGPAVLSVILYYIAFSLVVPLGRFAMSFRSSPKRLLKETSGE